MSSMDSTHEAAVDKDYKLRLIDEDTPTNRKLLLIKKSAGVLYFGQLSHADVQSPEKRFPSHWCKLPTF